MSHSATPCYYCQLPKSKCRTCHFGDSEEASKAAVIYVVEGKYNAPNADLKEWYPYEIGGESELAAEREAALLRAEVKTSDWRVRKYVRESVDD